MRWRRARFRSPQREPAAREARVRIAATTQRSPVAPILRWNRTTPSIERSNASLGNLRRAQPKGYSRIRPAARRPAHADTRPGAPRTRKTPRRRCTASRILGGHTWNARSSVLPPGTSVPLMIAVEAMYAMSRSASTINTTPTSPTQNALQSSKATIEVDAGTSPEA